MGRAIGILRLRLRQLPDFLVNSHANANRCTDSSSDTMRNRNSEQQNFWPPSTQLARGRSSAWVDRRNLSSRSLLFAGQMQRATAIW